MTGFNLLKIWNKYFGHPYSASENKNSMTYIETECQISEIAFLAS
jgi:hypothetical protein